MLHHSEENPTAELKFKYCLFAKMKALRRCVAKKKKKKPEPKEGRKKSCQSIKARCVLSPFLFPFYPSTTPLDRYPTLLQLFMCCYPTWIEAFSIFFYRCILKCVITEYNAMVVRCSISFSIY